MTSKSSALTMAVAVLTLVASPALAQRGGRGGGMQRGGGAGGGYNRGNYGGGSAGGYNRGNYGGGTGGSYNRGSNYEGAGSYNRGEPTGGFTGGATGANTRENPTMGAYGGAGAGAYGRPATPTAYNTAGRYGTAGYDAGRYAAAGYDAGRYGAGAYGARPYGTYYAGDAALYDQRNAIVARGGYPYYNPAMYGGYAGAWAPTNMMGSSMYANPGYGALAGMMGMGGQPTPYNYGSNVVSQPNGVYVNGDNVGTPQQYAAQASQLAATGNAPPSQDSQWQPLGVFAMAEGGQPNPLGIVVLAVNAQGVLRGNFHDMTNNAVSPISGAVDPKTQRAAWTVGGKKAPVYEAGIANLTQDQTTMLAHTAEGQQQQFSLLRLPEPPQGGAGNAPSAGGQ
jgi:hypothetical protein